MPIFLKAFGWKDIVDLGDITGARGQEMILPIWLRLFMTLKTPNLISTSRASRATTWKQTPNYNRLIQIFRKRTGLP